MTDKINLNKIEKLLSSSSTSSIYSTLTKIQQGEIIETDDMNAKLGISLNGFSNHKTLSEASSKVSLKNEKSIETVSEPISVIPSKTQTIEKKTTPYQVSILSCVPSIGDLGGLESTLMSVGGRNLKYSLRTVITTKHSEEVKAGIIGSDAGLIILPPFADTNDVHSIINKHVSELWSHNGLGPVPFIITTLEENIKAGEVSEKELDLSVQTFINHLNPITRGNYGFGIKCHFIKSKETGRELKKILRALSILLISYERFKAQKA